MSEQPSNSRKKQSDQSEWMRYAGLGFQLVGTVLFCIAIGFYLDRWLETSFPVFLLSFSLIGIVAAMVMLLRLAGKK